MTFDDFKQIILFKCLDVPSWAEWVSVDKNGDVYISSLKTVSMEHDGYHSMLPDVGSSVVRATIITKVDIPKDLDWKELTFKLN